MADSSSSISYGFSSETSSEQLMEIGSSLVSSISSGSSLSSASPECDMFEVYPRGREGIGVVQPQSGTDYPLLEPSEDVRYLLADLYLEYQGDFQLPFHVAYLHGFGCIPGVPAGIPPHVLTGLVNNIVIADNVGQIVFDSRDVEGDPYGSFTDRAWGPRNHIYEWQTETGICRLVTHTQWSPDEDPEPRQYGHHIVPQRAVIDDRALVQLPQRVQSLQVVLDRLSRRGVEFLRGYNMELTHVALAATVGSRVRHQIRFDATPGTGLGVFPGCTPPALTINKINSVPPTDAGDFHIAATDCFFVRQPTHTLGDMTLPDVNRIPGSTVEDDLPDPLAGTTTTARGWPVSKEYGHLQLGNDCKPCCDCDDYIAVAKYMNRIRNEYKAIGDSAMSTRGIYHQNRARFLAAAQCLQSRPLRIFLQPQICPFLDVALQFSNQTAECLTDLNLSAFIQSSPSGVATEVPGFTLITGASRKPGRVSGVTERYAMDGSWPIFGAHWDYVPPYASVSVRFRLEFDDCFTPAVVTGVLTGTLNGEPIQIPAAGSLSSAESLGVEEASASDTKTLNCPATHTAVKDITACYRAFLSESAAEP